MNRPFQLTRCHFSLTSSASFFVALVFFALFFPSAQAQSQNNASLETMKQRLLAYTQPESSLQTQIQDGLKRLKTLCDRSAPPPSASPRPPSSSDGDAQDRLFKKILATKNEARNQKRKLDLGLEQYRSANRLSELSSSCGSLPSLLRLSSSCRAFETKSERLQTVITITDQYYLDVTKRFDHYIEGMELESQGCARPGFAQRLWAAEETHMIPRMQGSAQFFIEQLNSD